MASVQTVETRSGVTDLLIIVPARGGSKRLPGKNLRRLAGRPLLDYTASAIVDAGLGSAVCLLSTDDQAIADHGKVLDWTVPWLRPANLSGDDAPTVDAVLHGLEWYRGSHGNDADPVMVLQPTSPLRGSTCLTRALALLQECEDAQAVVGMRRIESANAPISTPHRYVTNDDGFISAAPDTGALTPNGAVYAIRSAALRRHMSLYPPRTMPVVMDDIASIDIDTEQDWSRAEACVAAIGPTEQIAVARS